MSVSGMRGPWASWILCVVAGCVWVGLPAFVNAQEEMPSLKDLVKTAEKEEAEAKGEEQKKDAFPRKLGIEETAVEPQSLLPAGPLSFLEIPNAANFVEGYATTSLSALADHSKVKAFLKDNPFGVQGLFADLPPAYASDEGIELFLAAKRFSLAFLNVPGRVLFAVYVRQDGGVVGVFLADIGRNREEPFKTMEKTRDAFLDEYPAYVIQESAHEDDFLDVIRSEESGEEVAYGIVKNFAVVCTDLPFAQTILKAAQEGGVKKSLGASTTYGDLGQYTDGKAHARGFLDLPGILRQARLNALPTAAEMLDFVCDVMGRGAAGGEAGPSRIYYDLRMENGKMLEHVTSPTGVGDEAKPGVPARIRALCKTQAEQGDAANDWVTPRLVPYQPELFLAAHMRPSALAGLLTMPGNTQIGGSPYARELAASLPSAAKTIFSRYLAANADKILSGEIAFALLPVRRGSKRNWMMVMAVRNAAEADAAFAGTAPAAELNGVKIRCGAAEWEKNACWGVFDQSVFRHIKSISRKVPSSCLVVTSSGALMQEMIDQAVTISSLANNKDFLTQMEGLGEGHALVWYLNVPGTVGREYVNVSALLKTYFPRLQNVTNLPPMALINKSMFGVAGGVAPQADGKTVRTLISGPVPLIPSLAGLMTLKFPGWVRERGRMYQRRSRENLGKIWLQLQTYATQRGHYPESVNGLRELFPPKERESVFVVEAAVDVLGADAKTGSYKYLAGLRATDEPDLPIMYEAQPWHWEYAGMFSQGAEQTKETGSYQQYRLVLQLDGTIREYTEEEFKKRVLKRIRARE